MRFSLAQTWYLYLRRALDWVLLAVFAVDDLAAILLRLAERRTGQPLIIQIVRQNGKVRMFVVVKGRKRRITGFRAGV